MARFLAGAFAGALLLSLLRPACYGQVAEHVSEGPKRRIFRRESHAGPRAARPRGQGPAIRAGSPEQIAVGSGRVRRFVAPVAGSGLLLEGKRFPGVKEQLVALGGLKYLLASNASLKVDAKAIRLFCFAWNVRLPNEQSILPEVRQQFAKCDGSAIFTDEGAGGAHDDGIIRVHVAEQMKHGRKIERHEHDWLYHRNSAGLTPAWSYLLERGQLDRYDWVLNTEFDHFVRPSYVRLNIAGYLESMWRSTDKERLHVGAAMMLMWGNAFVFNTGMVGEMRRQWHWLGQTVPPGREGSGCPAWMKDKPFFPDECSQDIVYPTMVSVMDPPITAVGVSGCGKWSRTSKGENLPLGCYQMSENPLILDTNGAPSEELEIELLRKVASRPHQPSLVEESGPDTAAMAEVDARWNKFYPPWNVPIFHEVKWASVHQHARELLGL